MKSHIKKIVEILKKAGDLALKEQLKMTISIKKDTSIVTNGDLAVSSFLDKELSNLGYEVFSEENSLKIPKGKKVVIIDPIDGTESYSRKEDTWSILLGFMNGDIIEKGFVYQPTLNKLYYAEIGQGAFLLNTKNDSLSKISATRPMPLKGLSSPKNYGEEEFLYSKNVKEIKKMFSASLKIMEVAQGNADIYPNFRKKCSNWDLVAPLIILKESGGDIHFEKEFKINYLNPRIDFKFIAVGPFFFNDNFKFSKQSQN